jgi:serine/threonine protein kinase/tetratricopeptide (TPR) repeat protein
MNKAAPNIEEIFFAALEIKGRDARSAFLDEACGDPELRRRVERLLARDAQASGFLESPASTPTVTVESPSLSEGPGTAIGPYKLMEQIGEGGMGVVYVAEQTQPVRRRVALKVIKPGMDSRQVVARFEAERQALAMMDHPNIAKVHDGGTTDSGRPYFVMELVRGIPITEYCDAQKLTIRERLELFVLVCRAVQHAHQKGIIHRDLKPSNILITLHDGAPVPKVIDFGIAKDTGQSLTDKTVYTAFTQLVGTPLYMSPEQVELSGLDIDTRSDIYSLGVLLYELLTGTTPFDADTLRNAAFDEMRRIIREQEPQSPSVRLSSLGETLPTVSARRSVDARRLGPSLRGEVDWIVMKALEKDRMRRYETANDFASDVMRYLTDQPVEACPPSARYRFTKFVRRNRASLTTAALVAVALLAGTAVSAWQAMRAREAAVEAGQRAEESRQVVDYLAKDVFGAAGPSKRGRRSVTVGELFDRADATLGERFRRQPLVEASVRIALVGSYQELRDFGRAEQNAARAVQIRERYYGPQHPETLDALALQAEVFSSASWQDLRKARAAEPVARRVLAARRRVLGPAHPDTLATQTQLASTVSILGRHDEAEDLAAQAEELALRLLGPAHDHTLEARFVLGLIAQKQGNLARAEALLRQVAANRERLLGPLDPKTIYSVKGLAGLLREDGRFQEARQLYLDVVDRSVRMYGLSHIACSHPIGCLVGVLRQQRDHAAIRDLCGGWLREILTWPPEPDPYERSRRAVRLLNCALILATLPEPVPFDAALAVRAAEEAVALLEGRDGWATLGAVLSRANQNEEALQAIRTPTQRGDWDGGYDLHWFVRALIHARLGQAEQALSCYRRARGADLKRSGWDDLVQCIRTDVEGRLGVNDLPADAFARP